MRRCPAAGPRRSFAAGTTRPKALSKTDAIDKLAASTQLKKADVSAVVNGLLEMIQDSVKAGEKVTLTGCAACTAPAGAAARASCCLLGLGPVGRVPRRRRHGSVAAAGAARRKLRRCAPQARAAPPKRRIGGGARLPPIAGRWKSLTRPPARASFGTFEQRVRSARKGRNPATGKELDIPETKARGRCRRPAVPGRAGCAHALLPAGAGLQRGQVLQRPREGKPLLRVLRRVPLTPPEYRAFKLRGGRRTRALYCCCHRCPGLLGRVRACVGTNADSGYMHIRAPATPPARTP